MTIELATLTALLIKHYYIDFVNQTLAEVYGKGIYGNLTGIWHSAKQGILTAIIFFNFTDPVNCVVVGLLDFMLHYHIDWFKRNYGNQDIQNPKFWNHLGLDQLAHQLSYILYVVYF